MATMDRSLRDAYRALRRSPISTTAAVLCLAIGIGVTVTMVDVVDTLLFRPPPHVRSASDIVWLRLHFRFPGGAQHAQLDAGLVPYDSYVALSDGARTLGDVAAYTIRELSLDRGMLAQKVNVAFVTPSYFRLLGVHQALGRSFPTVQNHISDEVPQAILSHWLWSQQFGGDTAVVGRTVRVGNGSYTVIGIAPAGFRGVEFQQIGIWLPIGAAREEIFHGDETTFRETDWLQVLARPRHAATAEQVASEAASIWQVEFARRFGAQFGAIVTVTSQSIIPTKNSTWTREAAVSLWLVGIAATVLAIACGNVAHLLLIQALERQREMGIRLALGSSRGRLISQLVMEGTLLCLVSGVAALLLHHWSGAIIRAFLLPNIDGIGTSFDLRLLVAASLIAVFTCIGCSFAPALLVSRVDIVASLTGSGAVHGMARSGARAALLGGQIALTTALLVGAGLFVESLRSLKAVDLGFVPAHLFIGRVNLGASGYPESQSNEIIVRMLERIKGLPGVERASAGLTAPFVARITWPDFLVPGTQYSSRSINDARDVVEINAVTSGFFATIGTTFRHGHDFRDSDGGNSTPVVIVNTTMARTLWPDGDALGKCIKIGKPGSDTSAASSRCSVVIGVVQDTRTKTPRSDAGFQLYLPLSQGTGAGTPMLLVRASRNATSLGSQLRRTMQQTEPTLPFVEVRQLDDYIEPHLRPWRLGATMFGLLGMVALCLSMIGLYAAFAYSVSRRHKEIGVRMALGAPKGLILTQILKEGLRVTCGGLVVGIALAIAVGHFLRTLLIEVSWRDPYLLSLTAIVVLLTALLALYLPARHAVRVDPMNALRTE